ncbi:MAG: hypothetical protein Q7T04_07900 [Dehalococcoidia bacterium]|nr:hypothetical protein [Dehalococcoidia bacterium]
MTRTLLLGQRGLTILEVVVAVGITGLLATGLGSIGYGLLRHTQANSAHVTAASATEEAARLIVQDGQSAQQTSLVAGAPAVETLTLSWIDPTNGDSHEVVYSLSGNDVVRTKSVNSVVQSARTGARYMTAVGFSQPAGEGRLFKVSLTSSGGSATLAETREYYVALRAVD